MDIERKTVGFEVKEIDEEEGTFTGYAATFSSKPDSYGDVIDPGAFTKTLKDGRKRIKVLWQHSPMEPIGKPVEISEDEKGLLIKGKLSLGVQRAREILALMKDDVINEMSIGYETIKQEYKDGVRHLKEIRLYDTSPVTFAANPEAVIVGVKAELKPYPHEHACRLLDPDKFQDNSFRRTTRESDGKEYSVILGKLKGKTAMTEQAYRYDRTIWEEDEAREHCDDHDGTFEAAKEETFKCECIECGHKLESEKHCTDIKCPECGGKMRREERPGPGQKSGRVLSAASLSKVRAAIDALQALLDSIGTEPDPEKSNQSNPEQSSQSDQGISSQDVFDDLGAAEMEAVIAGLKAENEGFDVKQAEKRIEDSLAILAKINGGS